MCILQSRSKLSKQLGYVPWSWVTAPFESLMLVFSLMTASELGPRVHATNKNMLDKWKAICG